MYRILKVVRISSLGNMMKKYTICQSLLIIHFLVENKTSEKEPYAHSSFVVFFCTLPCLYKVYAGTTSYKVEKRLTENLKVDVVAVIAEDLRKGL